MRFLALEACCHFVQRTEQAVLDPHFLIVLTHLSASWFFCGEISDTFIITTSFYLSFCCRTWAALHMRWFIVSHFAERIYFSNNFWKAHFSHITAASIWGYCFIPIFCFCFHSSRFREHTWFDVTLLAVAKYLLTRVLTFAAVHVLLSDGLSFNVMLWFFSV